MGFQNERQVWGIALLIVISLLQITPSFSDPCAPQKAELAEATKARDQCLTRLQKTDESCEGSKVAKDLRESLKKKDDKLTQLQNKNSDLYIELLECQENSTRLGTEISQHESRKNLSDKRLEKANRELAECEKKVEAFGPSDASAAQKEVIFLRKQVKELQDSNKEKDTTIGELQKDLNELRVRDAVCQANYTGLEKDYNKCDANRGVVSDAYEVYRTVVEHKNIILSIIATALVGLVVTLISNSFRGQPPVQQPQPQGPHPEEIRRQAIQETLMITTGAMKQGGQMPQRIQAKFDLTFVCPEGEKHDIWFKKIEQNLAPLDVTINPQKLTEYDPSFPPSSTSVIIMSEKPEGSKFFCINQAWAEYFHIADNDMLIHFAKQKGSWREKPCADKHTPAILPRPVDSKGRFVSRPELGEIRKWFEKKLERNGPTELYGKRVVGKNFSISVIGPAGGKLGFADTVSLEIPEGALDKATVVHCFLPISSYEPDGKTRRDGLANEFIGCAPIVNCGPDGTKFNKEVILCVRPFTRPKDTGEANTLGVFTREAIGDSWKKHKDQTIDLQGEWLTIMTDHFSDFFVGCSAEAGPSVKQDVLLSTVIVTENYREEILEMMLVMTGNSSLMMQGFLSKLNKEHHKNPLTRGNYWLERKPDKCEVWEVFQNLGATVRLECRKYTLNGSSSTHEIPSDVVRDLAMDGYHIIYRLGHSGLDSYAEICNLKFAQYDGGEKLSSKDFVLPIHREDHLEKQPETSFPTAQVESADNIDELVLCCGFEVEDN